MSNSGLLFFDIGQPGGTAAYLVDPISDIGRRRKFGDVSCTEHTLQGNNFELIPMVKMETRHPIEGSFGSEFPSLYNQCGVIDVHLMSEDVKHFKEICAFC